MIIAVSACLLGRNCKYDGGNNYSETLSKHLTGHTVIEICPEAEVFPIPRPKIERCGDRIRNEWGEDVTVQCNEGVSAVIHQLKEAQVDLVILKSRSPTCGVRQIYDGTFSGKRIKGQGLLAERLTEEGFRIADVEDLLSEEIPLRQPK